jgi:hypothetical protein
VTWGFDGALGGTRTPSLLIRSQMLYPLSYERWTPLVYGNLGTATAQSRWGGRVVLQVSHELLSDPRLAS